jgi:hypothetical protein
MYGQMSIMAYHAGLEDSSEYTNSLWCEVVGESEPDITLFVTDTHLKDLPMPSNHKYIFATRMRVLGRYSSDVAVVADKIL